MWERDCGCLCDRFVFALHEESEQFSFSFHEDGSSFNETETVLLQDVIAVLHHLGSTNTMKTHTSVLEPELSDTVNIYNMFLEVSAIRLVLHPKNEYVKTEMF